MDHLISMYIDNELSLDDKVGFVEQVHADTGFKNEAISFLRQEKTLCKTLATATPEAELPLVERRRLYSGAAGYLGWGLAACLLLFVGFFLVNRAQPPVDLQPATATYNHRFVIYQSGIQQIDIVGSFTNWQRVPLQPAGASGYWEITLEIPPGEHAFSYIVDGNKILADPTIPTQEDDDFGTINSILIVEAS